MLKNELIEILNNLMSKNNEIRNSYELYFNKELESSLYSIIRLLLDILNDCNINITIRSLAGILLRRNLDNNIKDLSLLIQIRNELLSIWSNENNYIILRRLSHIIAQNASNGNWVDLIPSLLNHGSSIQGDKLISLLNLIEIIAEYCPDDILTHLSILVNFLGPFLVQSDINIQISCAKTVSACIVSVQDESARDLFKPAIQLIINILGIALTNGNETDSIVLMEYLATIALRQPLFFKGSLDNIVQAMIIVVSDNNLEFQTRSIALELMVTLTETAPALARRCDGLINGLVPLAMNLMLEIDENDDEWSRQDYVDDVNNSNDNDDNAIIGEEAIERAASGVGRVLILPVVNLVKEFSNINDSKYRRASVAALARLAEGSPDIFKKEYLEPTLPFLKSMIIDSSPRVKYQTIQFIGQLAILYPKLVPNLIENYFDALVHYMGDNETCERIRGHSISALINLCRPNDDLSENHENNNDGNDNNSSELQLSNEQLDLLLSVLCNTIQTTSINVQPVCLLLLGCIVGSVKEKFAPYYSSFMPGIKSIMIEAIAPHLSVLRAKAMECVGIIGEFVGDEVFASDALEVMEILLRAINEGEDTTYDHILPACARIARTLKSRFQPFLSYVMDPVLTGAGSVIQFSMEEAEDGDTEGEVIVDEETGLESAVVSLGPGIKKRVSLNTHGLQQKTLCTKMIYEYATSLKGDLGQYIIPCLEIVVNIVTDKHSSDLRFAASHAIPALFEAAIDATRRLETLTPLHLQEIFDLSLNKLVEAIKGEINSSARECAVESLRDIIELSYESGIEQSNGRYINSLCGPNLEVSINVMAELFVKCQESIQRRSQKEHLIKQNEGLDDEDREGYVTALEVEEDLLSTLVDTMGQFIKIHTIDLMPFIESNIAPHFSSYLQSTQPKSLQIMSICLLDDMLEYGGDVSKKYIPHCIEVFLRNMKNSQNSVLRQCSVYGIAQMLRYSPELCISRLSQIIPVLIDLTYLSSSNDDDDDNGGNNNNNNINQDNFEDDDDYDGIVENAIYSLGFICTTPELQNTAIKHVNFNEIFSIWLNSLPLKNDKIESKISLLQLLSLFERNDMRDILFGTNYENVPILSRIFSDVFLYYYENLSSSNSSPSYPTGLIHPETFHQFKNLFKELIQNQEIFYHIQNTIPSLTQQQQHAIETCSNE